MPFAIDSIGQQTAAKTASAELLSLGFALRNWNQPNTRLAAINSASQVRDVESSASCLLRIQGVSYHL
jgi:hypothetical protein